MNFSGGNFQIPGGTFPPGPPPEFITAPTYAGRTLSCPGNEKSFPKAEEPTTKESDSNP